jgi:hypothetical protein
LELAIKLFPAFLRQYTLALVAVCAAALVVAAMLLWSNRLSQLPGGGLRCK